MIKTLLILITFLSITNAAECSYQYVYQQKLIFDKTGNSQSECDSIKAEKEALVVQYEGTASLSATNSSDSGTSSSSTTSSSASNTTTAKTTSSSASSSSGQSVNTTGGCGMPPSFLRSSDAMSFSGNTLNKGLSSVQQSDFDNVAFKSGDSGNFSGFTCPQASEIKDATFPKNLISEDGQKAYSVKITGINFYTGAYTCEYSFLKSKTFYTVKRVNKACAQDAEAINKAIAKGDINSLPNLTYSQNYGMHTFNEGTINASDEFKQTYSNLLKGIADLSKSESQVAPVDVGGSLDSHSNHTNTLPSLFLGILTGDMEFLDNPVIDASGKIRIRNTSVNSSPVEVTDLNSLQDKFVSVFKSLDAQFWGFYYYLIANISHAFNHIVTMIFGLGTVGIFGYAFFRRSIDRDKESGAQFQFDFKNNFISAISALILFTAPIIPADKGIPSAFLYQPSTAPSAAQQEEILKNATVVQVGVRYIFQLGTYWANLIHDYSMFAYLKFISASYGYYDASEMKKNFKDDMSEFVTKSVLLKKEMDFFEKSCGTNYYSHLSSNHSLPDYYGGVDTNINYLKDNPLGFDSVDYGTCAAMFQKMQQASSDNFVKYKEIIKGYNAASDNMQSFLDSDMEEINGFLTAIVNISNKLGWVSVALVPSITDILETKKIFTFSNRPLFNSDDYSIVQSVGEMEVKKVDLVKRNELEAGKSQAIKEDVKVETSSDTWRWIKSLVDSNSNLSGKVGISIGWAMGQVASGFGYFMFPGFGELYAGIEKTTIPTVLINLTSSGASIVTKFIPFMKGPIGGIISGISKLDKFEIIKKTKEEDAKGIMIFATTYLLSLFLYCTLLAILMVALITLLTVSKIIYYFIEVIIAVFISTAVMLWGLIFDKTSSSSTIGEFFYKIVLLALSPISIVLSIYAFLFAKGAMLWLYRLIAEFILFSSKNIILKLDSKNEGIANLSGFDNIFAGIQAYGVYNMGEMIIVFFTIFIAYNIIFHFHDWILAYFGHKGDTGIQRNMDAVFQEVKQRTMTKV